MNIAIASTFHPYRGGIATFNNRLAETLISSGHKVSCYNWSRQYPSILFPGEAQTLAGHPTPKRSQAPLDSINPRTWKKTADKILEGNGVDLLLLPFWHASLAPALKGVAKRVKRLSPNTKVVALMHNASSHDGSSVDKWLTKRFLKKIDSCITLCDAVKDGVHALAPGLDCNVLFHPLYDHYQAATEKSAARKNLNLPQDAKVALFFGLIRPYKGLDILLKAINDVDQNTNLLIAGECYGSFSKYADIISQSGIESRVFLIKKFVAEDELPDIFGASDFIVLPYLKATQSGVVATSIHYNLPIIASEVGDLSKSIKIGVTGDLVEPGNHLALAASINSWTSSNKSEKEVSEAYDLVKQEKSWESFVEKLINLYKV